MTHSTRDLHGLAAGFLIIIAAMSVRAQLVADGTTKTITATTTNLAGDLVVGTNGSFTTLIVANAGGVTNTGSGTIGLNSSAKTNQVLVTDANSFWGMSGNVVIGNAGSYNSLMVSNGGKVVNNFGNIALSSGSGNNSVLVTGPNSL